MIIGTVVEGPTDRLLLKAIINHVYPGKHTYLDLQPADVGETFSGRGTGWKGVRRFCFDVWQHLSTSTFDFIADHRLDLLIIHVDADIANESDLQVGRGELVINVPQPCPPVSPTVEKLHEVIMKWLHLEDEGQLPSKIIFAIPAQDSEYWIFAALFPDDQLCQRVDYECSSESLQRPAYKLTLQEYGRVLRRKDGKPKKNRSRYRTILPDVVKGWEDACRICTQAQSFTDELNSHHE